MPLLGSYSSDADRDHKEPIPRWVKLLIINYFRSKLGMTHQEALDTADDLVKYVDRNS